VAIVGMRMLMGILLDFLLGVQFRS